MSHRDGGYPATLSLPAPRTPHGAAEWIAGWRRLHQLGRLATAGERKGRGLAWPWFGKLCFALGGVATLLMLAVLGAGNATDVVVARLYAYASWLEGFALLGALSPVRPSPAEPLAALRGYSPLGSRYFAWALGERVAHGFLLSTLPIAIAAVVWLPDAAPASLRWSLVPFTVGYALVLAATLGTLAGVARRIGGGAPRAVVFALVLVPAAAAVAWPGFPNIPGFLGSLLGYLASLGGESLL
ncbi:MAG TPA: hypothetical protein VLC09_17515 [Polyangiaceae bacterium]|nr:hypothetical protein [Polyangiaceae bacterium]